MRSYHESNKSQPPISDPTPPKGSSGVSNARTPEKELLEHNMRVEALRLVVELAKDFSFVDKEECIDFITEASQEFSNFLLDKTVKKG